MQELPIGNTCGLTKAPILPKISLMYNMKIVTVLPLSAVDKTFLTLEYHYKIIFTCVQLKSFQSYI